MKKQETEKTGATETPVLEIPKDELGVVDYIVALMLKIDNNEDALRLCQIIHLENPELYNLVMGGVVPQQK